MNRTHVIRSWKDPIYCAQLSVAERDALPAHPAEWFELSPDEVAAVAGAMKPPGTHSMEFICTIPTPISRVASC